MRQNESLRGVSASHSVNGVDCPIDLRVCLLVLFLVPWMLFLINANWPFQGIPFMDPWYYFGHFIHFPHYQQLNPTYAGERLPWLIPGIILNAILPPAYAELALHLCFCWISLFSLFYLVRHVTDNATAVLTAVLMGTHPMFVSANGWTYTDSGCIVYLLLAFVCLMCSCSAPHPGRWLVLAGSCWAALIYTYPFWIVLTPCCAIFYLGLMPELKADSRLLRFLPARRLIAGAYFFAGALIATAFFSTIHLLVQGEGHGFFFRLNIATSRALGNRTNVYALPGDAWITDPSLIFPIVTLVICLAVLLLERYGKRHLDRAARAIVWTYMYAIIVLLLFTVYRTRILAFSYYCSILIPLLFLTLAVTALRVITRPTMRLLLVVVGSGFFLSSLSLWRVGLYRYGLPERLWIHYGLAITGALLPLFWIRRSAWAVGTICICVASFGLIPKSGPNVAWTVSYDGLSTSMRIGDAVKRIQASLPYNSQPVFWIDNFTSIHSAEYRAIMCAFLSHGISMWHYPKVDVGADSLPAAYPPGTQLILITETQDVFEKAESTMRDMGMPLRLRGQQLISRDGVSYWLTFAEVTDPAKEPGVIQDAVRVDLVDTIQLAYEKASVESDGRSWKVITAPEQWAYAAQVLLPIKRGQSGSVQVRARVLHGRIGYGLLERSNRFAMEQFVDGPSKETSFSLPLDPAVDVGALMIRNAGATGESESVVDAVELELPGRKVTGLGKLQTDAGASGGAGSGTFPVTIQSDAGPGSVVAVAPFSLKRATAGLYLECKARLVTGKMMIEVVDRQNGLRLEQRMLDSQSGNDVFIRIPTNLQEGKVQFHNAAPGVRAKAVVLDLALWEVR